MTIVDELLKAEMKWESSVGGTFPGKGAEFRGFDMFQKFKDWNWLSMFYFSATGRELSKNSEQFFNGLYCMCFSYPDSRIWNNGVATFAGTARSTAQLAVCSAHRYSAEPGEIRSLFGSVPRAVDLLHSGSRVQDDYPDTKKRGGDDDRLHPEAKKDHQNGHQCSQRCAKEHIDPGQQ